MTTRSDWMWIEPAAPCDLASVCRRLQLPGVRSTLGCMLFLAPSRVVSAVSPLTLYPCLCLCLYACMSYLPRVQPRIET